MAVGNLFFRLTGLDCEPLSTVTRNLLLIGGNSGIGLVLAERLRAQGDNVICTAREPGEGGANCQRFDALTPERLELPPVLDGLVYLPGTVLLKPFHRTSEDDFLRDFQINCLGAVQVIQAALPAMKAAPTASIILFSSVAVAQGMAFHASIAAAKGAVEGLAKSLAAEFAPKIRVNVIAPSLTDTPLVESLLNSDAKRDAAAKRHPLQQIGRAEDVASLAVFLLSDASRFLTGQVLRPDGGLSSIRTF